MESAVRPERITFADLQARLIEYINGRIRNGYYTERGLARILGVSQPQFHNVLKGTRKLKSELADRILLKLGMDVMDLLKRSEMTAHLAAERSDGMECPDRAGQVMGGRGGSAGKADPIPMVPRKPPARIASTVPAQKQAS